MFEFLVEAYITSIRSELSVISGIHVVRHREKNLKQSVTISHLEWLSVHSVLNWLKAATDLGQESSQWAH